MSRNCSWFERELIEPWSNTTVADDMERPPSQLENVRPSGLKQPSRLPAMGDMSGGRTLLETSQSDLNARSAMPPPPGRSEKHKMSGRTRHHPGKRYDRSSTDDSRSPRTTSQA